MHTEHKQLLPRKITNQFMSLALKSIQKFQFMNRPRRILWELKLNIIMDMFDNFFILSDFKLQENSDNCVHKKPCRSYV